MPMFDCVRVRLRYLFPLSRPQYRSNPGAHICRFALNLAFRERSWMIGRTIPADHTYLVVPPSVCGTVAYCAPRSTYCVRFPCLPPDNTQPARFPGWTLESVQHGLVLPSRAGSNHQQDLDVVLDKPGFKLCNPKNRRTLDRRGKQCFIMLPKPLFHFDHCNSIRFHASTTVTFLELHNRHYQ